jgi:hypothetical protein
MWTALTNSDFLSERQQLTVKGFVQVLKHKMNLTHSGWSVWQILLQLLLSGNELAVNGFS